MASFRHPKSSLHFSFVVTDLTLDFASVYQPNNIVLSVARHRNKQASGPVKWEASLKTPNEGFCFWHPPFRALLRVTEEAKLSHKDIYVSIENVDAKGKKKLLAKARVDLMNYQTATQTFRLKLHPETKKVSRCYANATITLVDKNDESEKGAKEDQQPLMIFSASGAASPVSVRTGNSAGDALSHSSGLSSPPLSAKASSSDLSARGSSSVRVPVFETVKSKPESVSSASPEPFSVVPSVTEVRPQPVDRSSVKAPSEASSVKAPSEKSSEKAPSVASSTKTASPPPSPKVLRLATSATTPKIQTRQLQIPKKQEDEVLTWAKEKLKSYHQIKITNLSSSWQNGLAFCALLHTKYPELIPIGHLDPGSSSLNFSLALSVSKLVGMNVSQLMQASSNTKLCLQEFRRVLENGNDDKMSDDSILAHKRKWFLEEGLFSNEFPSESFSDSRDDPSVSSPAPVSRPSSIASTPSSIASPLPSIPLSTSTPAVPVTEKRQRVLDIIAQAKEEEEKKETEVVMSNEMKLLELENDRITHEQTILERILRDNTDASEDVLPRYLQLVNEKNGLVRRQMQLNILEKEAEIGRRQEKLQEELQQLALMEDENKTQASRDREQELLTQLVELVNEKNELVHHLDNQERGIEEDETIEASLTSDTLRNKEECVIQ